jgi:C4-dicarboxylate transporter DctQ subunit
VASMPDDNKPATQRPIEELIFIKIPQVTAGVLFLVAVVINIVNVIGRYVFAAPVFWAEEALSFILIWIVFLVAGSITYRGAHLNMDLVYSMLPKAWKQVVRIAIVIALIVCTLFTAFQSWKIVALHLHNHSVTAGTEIPLVIPTSALLFGFSFMAVAAIVRFRSYLSGKFD